MSKEEWFREFERCEAEHPDWTDDELSDMAYERMVDRASEIADRLAECLKDAGRPLRVPRKLWAWGKMIRGRIVVLGKVER